MESLIPLRKALLKLYDEPADIRRVCDDAGIDSTTIDVTGSALNIWHSVLHEAHKQDKVTAIVTVASKLYPSSVNDLENSLDIYIQGTGGITSVPASVVTAPFSDDELSVIERRLAECTRIHLLPLAPSIQGITIKLPQLDQIEELLQSNLSVWITGNAGVGKSGIAYHLANNSFDRQSVLFLDARKLAQLSSLQDLRAHLDIDIAVVDAISSIAQSFGCRIIIDQLDSVFETPCAELLCNFACICAEIPGAQAVVITRNTDRSSNILEQLEKRNFKQVLVTSIDTSLSQQLLLKLGISSPPQHVIDLATNLLNLDLISRIQAEKPFTDLDLIDEEVKLWQYYLETIRRQESVGTNSQRGLVIINEAIRLAWEGLNTPERTVILTQPQTIEQHRLIDWDILQQKHNLFYTFRHEKLHEFLAAKDAVDRDLTPEGLMHQMAVHRTSSIVTWMDKLYVHAEARYRERFIARYLAGENGLPFYTKLALLAQYLQTDISQEDPNIIRQILQIVESDPGLRKNFFKAVPHYSWASALWNHGFFDAQPLPVADAEGRQFLTHWDVQRYLIAVAHDAWDIVIRHVQSIDSNGWYIQWAIEALCHIPPEYAVPLLPRILNWLEDPFIAQSIDHPTFELMLGFAKAKLEDPAFALFGAMIMPILPPRSASPTARLLRSTIKPRLLGYYSLLNEELPLLRALNLTKMIQILEGRLRLVSALLSEHHRSTHYRSDWRSAIEVTDQDHDDQFEEKLLVALRDSLAAFVEDDPFTAKLWISRYLVDDHTIFRRLGLHLLARHPDKFPDLVAEQLLNRQNLDDIDIHHELFMLLHSGFAVLEVDDRRQLIVLIQTGFPVEREQRYREWFERNNPTADIDQEVESMHHCWVRDRLWMIRVHLTVQDTHRLDELIAKVGKPSHPEFLTWTESIDFGKVQDISPLSEAHIAAMNADELVHQVIGWSPSLSGNFFRQRSYEGLADAVARVISSNLNRYAEHGHKVAILHSIFAEAILGHLANQNNAPSIPWPTCIELIELLLPEPVRTQIIVEAGEINWAEVRRAIIRLLERGLEETTELPSVLYPQVEAILFKLLDDNDPDFENDNPSSDHDGIQNDPLIIALNHVRPLALDLLIRYQIRQILQVSNEKTQPGDHETLPKRRLNPVIAATLNTRLDPSVEQSLGVRAIFGQRLQTLYWLDSAWTETHLDQILPEDDGLQSTRFFLAAWNTFVVRYHYCSDAQLLEWLRPKYVRAISFLTNELVTKSLDPAQGLAKHLIVEYLKGTYAIDEPISQQNLLRMFFAEANADMCAHAAWVAWRFCADNPRRFWPRVKLLWAWRLQEIAMAGNSVDGKSEIGYFAQLPAVIHSLESMLSMQDLLTATSSYLFDSSPSYGSWEKFEEFLVHKVDQEPLAVIEFYQMMRDHQSDPYRFRPNETRRQILTVGAENQTSRSATLDLIDSIAALGEHGYKDIYLRFA